MQSETCSMHCGHFSGIDAQALAQSKGRLEELFSLVEYDAGTGALSLCGARNVEDSPANLTAIFDELSQLLGPGGKGRMMVNCDGRFEACFFRSKMWKLMAVGMPEDPFEGLRITD